LEDAYLALDLGLDSVPKSPNTTRDDLPLDVVALVDAREDARKEKDWKKADALREEIEKRGYVVKDTDSGVKVL